MAKLDEDLEENPYPLRETAFVKSGFPIKGGVNAFYD
jgi:hypothetical protein